MNVIEEKSFAFAVNVVSTVKEMRRTQKEYELTSQFVRSGTSIGANVSEAVKAQSKNDFIAKMSIASKEANETRYWIRLLRETKYLDEAKGKELQAQAEELIRILTSIIKTSQERKESKPRNS